MAAVACPECDARVSVPDGTRAGVEVTCPGCNGVFTTPDGLGPAPAPPKPTTVVGGRSDYLDATDFTPDKGPKKPKPPRFVVSGPVTVGFIIGSVFIAASAGGLLVYTALKVQGRVANATSGGAPLDAAPVVPREDAAPAPPRAVPPPDARPDAPPRAPVGLGVAADAEAGPPAAAAQPATADEAWDQLVGTWKLVGKPADYPADETYLQKLTFGPGKSATLTDNLFEHSKGKSPNYEDLNTVTAVKVTKAGVTLHLRQKAGDEDHTLSVVFDGRDRITVRQKPREDGPEYLFTFARS